VLGVVLVHLLASGGWGGWRGWGRGGALGRW
jgi:hypothetical protein